MVGCVNTSNVHVVCTTLALVEDLKGLKLIELRFWFQRVFPLRIDLHPRNTRVEGYDRRHEGKFTNFSAPIVLIKTL